MPEALSPSPRPPASSPSRSLPVGIALALVILTGWAFWGVLKNEFIDYDDPDYATANEVVKSGLTREGVKWAFTTSHANNWHPLTWLSHMLDVQLYGLNPAGHHATNLILHMVNVALLFFALRMMTGSLGRSAMVAALFGVHPLHVESVAWAAERKDVLSGLFFMLTLIAYARYVRNQNRQASGGDYPWPTAGAYWLTLLCYALGLMSKPMLVTLPFVLVLLDYWPFQRYDLSGPQQRWDSFTRLVREKVPFFLLTLASSAITLQAQDTAVMSMGAMPLSQRLGNAVQAYLAYLQQIFWPQNLAVFYPKPALLFAVGAWGALAILALITLACARTAKPQPYLVIGWFFYLGVLVPVIGIVQVGSQAQADRYTYLPAIGIFILAVWWVAARVAQKRVLRWVGVGVAGAGVLMLGALTRRQVAVWRNTETLFVHAANATRNNYVALSCIARIDIARGRIPEAAANVEQILRIAPQFPWAEYLMGTVLQMQGRMPEAIPHLLAATGNEVRLPGQARLVLSYIDGGRFAEADAALAGVLGAFPNSPDAWLMKAALLKEQGQIPEAVDLFRKVVAARPPPLADNPTMNFELAELYSLAGENQKAGAYYAKAIALAPQLVTALNNYAWLLATDPDDHLRNGALAVRHAEQACATTQWKQPVFLGTLAAAYAEAGRFADAVKMATRARDQARAEGATALAQRNEDLRDRYQQGKPYREAANPAPSPR